MASLKSNFSTAELAQALEISPSGFEAHLHKPQRPRRQEDQKLVALIKPIFKENRKTYGSPRLCLALRKAGLQSTCGF